LFVRTPQKALNLLLADLQAAVSCVTRGVLRTQVVEGPPFRGAITFGGTPPRAKVGRRQERWIEVNLAIEARQDDEETGSWRTHTLRYDFSLYDSPDAGPALLAYHFHPDPEGRGHQRPHLHVRAEPAWARRSLARAHLPTGRVTCESFVRLLIEEFGIRRARSDWDQVLSRRESVFEARRTW
jgi:hypothetical protein